MLTQETLNKLIKFGLIGFGGMLIDYSITAFLKEILELNKYIANTSGFICAASSNYILNRKFTFKSSNPKMLKEYSGFLTIAIAGLALNNTIIWLLVDKVMELNFYLAKFIAITTVFVWNFFMNNYFNFKQRGEH